MRKLVYILEFMDPGYRQIFGSQDSTQILFNPVSLDETMMEESLGSQGHELSGTYGLPTPRVRIMRRNRQERQQSNCQ